MRALRLSRRADQTGPGESRIGASGEGGASAAALGGGGEAGEADEAGAGPSAAHENAEVGKAGEETSPEAASPDASPERGDAKSGVAGVRRSMKAKGLSRLKSMTAAARRAAVRASSRARLECTEAAGLAVSSWIRL